MLSYRMIFLILVAVLNAFWGIGVNPLMDPDEPAYAQTAKEMLQAGDYLSPRIFGDFWFDKPPMYYWLVVFSYKIFGVSEFAARFPASMAAVLVVLVLYHYAQKFFNENVAFIAALVMASCINFFYIAKASVTDMTLLLFLSTALYAYLDEDYYLMYLCAGLATLTKGPIGIVFTGAIAVLHMLATKDFKPLLDKKLYSGWLIYFAVTVPWYWLMYEAHGQVFVDTFLGLHNAGRFANPEHPGRVVWHYYIPVLILGLFPWINMFVNAVVAAVRNSSRGRSKLLFFQIWWVFVFLFFSVAQTKLVSYIFPLFPAAALLIGWYLNQISDRFALPSKWTLLLPTGLFFGLFAAGMVFAPRELPTVANGAYTIAACTVITALLVSYAIYKGNIQAVIITQALLSVVIMFTLVNSVLPMIVNSFSVKALATNYKLYHSGTQNLYVDKFLRPGFAFYTDEWGSELVDKRNEAFNTDAKDSKMLPEIMQSYGAAGSKVVVRRSVYNRLSAADKARTDILYDSKDMLIMQIIK